MSFKHPLVLQGALAPPPPEGTLKMFKLNVIFLFQNASEVSDEELNDDLLRSDEEDIDMRFSTFKSANLIH